MKIVAGRWKGVFFRHMKLTSDFSFFASFLQYITESTALAKGSTYCTWSCWNWDPICLWCPSLCIDWNEFWANESVYQVCCWSLAGISLFLSLIGRNIFVEKLRISIYVFQVALGCPRKYNVQNPFDWMEFISLQ